MEYIYLLIGLSIGGLVAFLWIKQRFSAKNATLQTENRQSQETLESSRVQLEKTLEEKGIIEKDISDLKISLNTEKVNYRRLEEDEKKLREKLTDKEGENLNLNRQLATAEADNKSLEEKLATQKEELKTMRKEFNTEFENIAGRILKDNTKSFSEFNETKIKELLNPLGEDIKKFKTKVEEVYDKEAKERFSLGEKVKELAEKSDKISQDAINLTNALKGEVKTQGRWGEMILERILEKSGLRKGENYFMEEQLSASDGKPLLSEEGKKMRPDAIVKYPDERNVIIDSKVSLNAFTRYSEATTPESQKEALDDHLRSIKNHILGLSSKGYENYDKALDFVMLFIPNDPAYIAAMQTDPDLWSFAYDKRVLLINPTNLITALKLIVDLWKREYQNKNAQEIANRGEKLYDKFVGFVDNMEGVGNYIEKAKEKYDNAYGQLKTGRGNLIFQAESLKKLGIRPKKNLNPSLIEESQQNDKPV